MVVDLSKTNLSQYVGIAKPENISFVGCTSCSANGSIKTRTEFPTAPVTAPPIAPVKAPGAAPTPPARDPTTAPPTAPAIPPPIPPAASAPHNLCNVFRKEFQSKAFLLDERLSI